MPVIVKLEGKYLLWSNATDAPCGPAMTLDELRAYTKEEHGAAGLRDLEERLVRVEAHGTSSMLREDAAQTMWLNRAGAGETPLTREQLVEYFVRRGCKGPRPKGFVEPPDLPDDHPDGWTFARYVGAKR